LVIDWPPNTGNSVADMEIADDVRKYLENDWAVVFTPEGRLKLVNGKIMLGKAKTKQEKRKR